MQKIPNHYLHFGDFDIAGIGIYINEFKKYLKTKASFFIPENIEDMIAKFGNKSRYNLQKINFDITTINEPKVETLLQLIHQNKKGLDQEIFIKK